MITRLQRDIRCRTTRIFSRRFESIDFSVRHTGALMPSLANYSSFAHNDAADARIGSRGIQTALGETQRLRHVKMVVWGKHHESNSRCNESIAAAWPAFCGLLHFLNRVAEIFLVLETPVYRGKTDVRHLIHFVQLFHDHFTDAA